jgi:hypothetical protein
MVTSTAEGIAQHSTTQHSTSQHSTAEVEHPHRVVDQHQRPGRALHRDPPLLVQVDVLRGDELRAHLGGGQALEAARDAILVRAWQP